MGNREQNEREILEGLAVDTADAASIRRTMTVLMDHIQAIDAQLGDQDKTDAEGRRLSDQEYWAWRTKAVHAKTIKLRQYRHLKARVTELIERQNGAQRTFGPVPNRRDLGAYLAADLHALPADACVSALRGVDKRLGPLLGSVRILQASDPDDPELDDVCGWVIDALCDLHALCTRRGWLTADGVAEERLHG